MGELSQAASIETSQLRGGRSKLGKAGKCQLFSGSFPWVRLASFWEQVLGGDCQPWGTIQKGSARDLHSFQKKIAPFKLKAKERAA